MLRSPWQDRLGTPCTELDGPLLGTLCSWSESRVTSAGAPQLQGPSGRWSECLRW